MSKKHYEFNQEIKTVGELKKYLGMPIYFSYYDKCNPLFAWIKTAEYTTIDEYGNYTSIRNIGIMGKNALRLIKGHKQDVGFIKENDYIRASESNAQEYARTLTKEEFKMYAKKTAVRRCYQKFLLDKKPI